MSLVRPSSPLATLPKTATLKALWRAAIAFTASLFARRKFKRALTKARIPADRFLRKSGLQAC
jgi:hypothetical protein